MKKIALVLICVLFILTFASGCGEDPLNPDATLPSSDSSEKEIKDSDFPDSIEGIYKYLLELDYVSKADPTEMSADLIGAQEGSKYAYRLNGKQVTVEIYRYDTDNLNETAQDIINSVQTKGTFEILGLGDVEATLSDSGKYLLIYSDTAFDSANPNEHNVKMRDSVIKAFKAFHN